MASTSSHRYTFKHPNPDGQPVTLEILESQMKLAQEQDVKDPNVRAARQAISLRYNMHAKPRVVPPVKADWLLANMTDDGAVTRYGRPAKGTRRKRV